MAKHRAGAHSFEETDDGIWSVYYSTILLARFDARERKFHT